MYVNYLLLKALKEEDDEGEKSDDEVLEWEDAVDARDL